MVVTRPFGERILNWLFLRRKTVREGGLFHELDKRRVADEAIEEAVEKVKSKTKGYRNG
jgi:hypothetical protein